jgi:hypothetical protein
MSSQSLAPFAGQKYLNLESVKLFISGPTATDERGTMMGKAASRTNIARFLPRPVIADGQRYASFT